MPRSRNQARLWDRIHKMLTLSKSLVAAAPKFKDVVLLRAVGLWARSTAVGALRSTVRKIKEEEEEFKMLKTFPVSVPRVPLRGSN